MTQIEIKNLSKTIQGNAVLQNISLVLHSGKIYGLQGINGSGKTMLMRALIGLIRPTEGAISINGQVLGKDIEFPESIGFLLESPTFLDRYTGFDNLKMLASIQRKIAEPKIRETIAAVGLNPADKRKYRKYSLGMKQRLGIAAAIMEDADIIILDEPTNALDTFGIDLVKNILLRQKERGALIMIACHDLSILQNLSNEVIKMESGRIVEL
ncbi:ATP-binding cassette domain-containing protein [Lachnospiraceae bacterium ZAX-1]